jgi:hypothetical protein
MGWTGRAPARRFAGATNSRSTRHEPQSHRQHLDCDWYRYEGNASVCTKWGVANNSDGRDNINLTDVVRLKLELPVVRAAIKAHDKLDRPDLIAIDHRGAGIGVWQELRKAGFVTCITQALTENPMTAKSIDLERRFSISTTAS